MAAEIDACWHGESQRRQLHDGAVLCVRGWTLRAGMVEIDAAVVRYRWWLAQRLLGRNLGVHPLAVTGLCRANDGRIAIGCRSRGSASWPGAWELVPAGSVDAARIASDGTVDLEEQLAIELAEEVGCATDGVRHLGLSWCADDLVFDAVFAIALPSGARPRASGEHSAIELADPAALAGRVDLVPSSAAIIASWPEAAGTYPGNRP